MIAALSEAGCHGSVVRPHTRITANHVVTA